MPDQELQQDGPDGEASNGQELDLVNHEVEPGEGREGETEEPGDAINEQSVEVAARKKPRI